MIGGMEKFCIDICNEFSKEHEVMLLCDPCFKPYISSNVHYVELDIKKSRNNFLFLYEIYGIIFNFKADIIHAHKQKSIQILKRLKPFLTMPFVATKHDIKEKKSFYGLDYAISISDVVTDTIKAKKIYKIYNGISIEKPKKINLSNSFNIVAVGGLKPVKGYDLLIKAISKLRFDFHLTIVGEGVLRDDLTELISKLEIQKNVSLVGLKSNVCDYIFSSDMQIVSSLHEGFALVLAEGIFYAPILVSTNVGIAKEVLHKELIYDINNMSKKVEDIYNHKQKYREYFDGVKEKYKEKLTMTVCVEEHINVYQDIINKESKDKL
jgi:glycosyltransferase involved in cell wall biosynthesis